MHFFFVALSPLQQIAVDLNEDDGVVVWIRSQDLAPLARQKVDFVKSISYQCFRTFSVLKPLFQTFFSVDALRGGL